MIQQEYIEKFEKIISYYNIDKSDVYDVAKAISFAESFGTHPISINDLAECGVDYFKDITNAPKAKELPDTRIMRMLCDTLTVILFTTNNTLFSKPNLSNILKLLSDNVCDVLVQTDKYVRPNSEIHIGRSNDYYKSVEECEKVLNILESTCNNISENYADLFNWVSDTLNRLKHLLELVDKKYALSENLFDSLYLPSEYDSHGYKVLTDLPEPLKLVAKGSLEEQLEIWELSKFMDVLIMFLSGSRDSEFYRNIFINKLVRITNTMQDLIPIGISASTGARVPIYTPDVLLKNQTSIGLYNKVFDSSVALTKQSIESLFMVCKRLYNIREEV